MFNRLRYRLHVWRVLRALRRAENPRLSNTVRLRAAQHCLELVNAGTVLVSR